MSENTVNSALRAMGYDTKTEVCGHGFVVHWVSQDYGVMTL